MCLGSGSCRECILNDGEGRQVFNVLIWNKSVWMLPDLFLFVWLLSANTMSFSFLFTGLHTAGVHSS